MVLSCKEKHFDLVRLENEKLCALQASLSRLAGG